MHQFTGVSLVCKSLTWYVGGGELVDEGSPYTAEAHEWCGGQAGKCRGVIVTWVESASVQDSTLSFSRFFVCSFVQLSVPQSACWHTFCLM